MMIIVVDGYNVLKKIHGPEISETQRSAFVNLLGRYLKKRQHKIVVMFDGGPFYYPSTEKQKGVTVWYSGQKQSADDLIISYAQEHHTKELLVVTLDGQLCAKVGESRVETVDPNFFYERVRSVCDPEKRGTLSENDEVNKLSEENDEELDQLMYEAAGMRVPLKEESSDSFRKKTGTANHDSKKERAYRRYIDKL